MGMLEDLMLGLSSDEEIRERLKEEARRRSEWVSGAFRGIGEDWESRGADPYEMSRERAGAGAAPSEMMRDVAQAAIGKREDEDASEAEQVIIEAKRNSDLAKEEQDRQLSNMLDMPEDKLWKIKAQAGAKGRAGSLGAGVDPTVDDYMASAGPPSGSFSQQEMTPEIAARGAERDKWLAGQSERDLEYAMSPEMARRDPEYAATAAQNLQGLRRESNVARRTANQERLVDSLSGGGTLPFETAMKMEAAGMDIPWRAVGMSPSAAEAGIEEIFTGAEQNLAQFANNEELMYKEGARETVEFLQYILAHRDRVGRMMSGGADPLKILERMKEIASRQAKDSGAWAFWDANVPQQQPEAP